MTLYQTRSCDNKCLNACVIKRYRQIKLLAHIKYEEYMVLFMVMVGAFGRLLLLRRHL